MNERIRQLAVMANPSSKEIYEADNWQYNCAAWDSNNLTKFAELIVSECIELNKQELAFNAFERMLNRYKEHFGVEE